MAEPMTTARLDEISALADAATPGPWAYTPNGRVLAANVTYPRPGDISYTVMAAFEECDDLACDRDGEFVAAARTAVPELLAEVRRARAAEAFHLKASTGLSNELARRGADVEALRNRLNEVREENERLRAGALANHALLEAARDVLEELAKERDAWRARVEGWCDDEGCAIPCTPNCTRSEAERA